MNGAGVRVYLSDEERAALAREAADRGASLSYVMRLGLRLLVGLPTPRGEQREGGRREVGATAR